MVNDKRTKPILSRDGLTLVEQCHAFRRGLTHESVEGFVARTLSLVDKCSLERFSAVKPFVSPSPWEFDYLMRGSPKQWTYEEYAEARRPFLGAWTINLNFRELSHAARIYTRDMKVVDAFREAFARNPAAEQMSQYQTNLDRTFDQDRTRYLARKEKARG
jgi:hypothetical protein